MKSGDKNEQMTTAQEAHLLAIKERFARAVDAKYRTGAAEHGGNLWDNDALKLIDLAIEEAVDQVTYLMTLRDKVTAANRKTLTVPRDEWLSDHIAACSYCVKGDFLCLEAQQILRRGVNAQ